MNDPRTEYFGMSIPNYTCEAKAAQFIRRKIKKGHTTPTIQTIAQVIGAAEMDVEEAIETLTEIGTLKCEWCEDGEITRYALEFERRWRWTIAKKSRYKTGRDELPTITEWGGGPIARMTPTKRGWPTTKQDEAINKVFAGRKFENDTFPRDEFKR